MLSLFLGLFLLVIFSVKFSIDIQFIYRDGQSTIAFYVGFGPFLWRLPPMLVRKTQQIIRSRPVKSAADAYKRLQLIIGLLDNFIQEIELFELQVFLSLGDPFRTALACGGFWGMLGPFLTSGDLRFKDMPKIAVTPLFGAFGLEVDFRCIFRFRLGQIILSELADLAYALSAST